jgi:hypothetical protein
VVFVGFRGAPPASATPLTVHAGVPVFAVSGSSGYGSDPGGSEPPGDRGGRGGRDLNYYSEERYWTDYLRIAAPILGVILMVVLFWLWASSFLGDDDDDTGNQGGTPTSLPTIGPTSAASPSLAAGGTPTVIIIGTTAPPTGAATATTAPDEPTPTEGVEPPPADFFVSAIVEVANTDGAGANLRSDATTSSEIIATLLEGTRLTITGEAISAEEFIWWPVEAEDGTVGYMVQDFLQLVP